MANSTFHYQIATWLNCSLTEIAESSIEANAMHNGLFHFAHACFLISYLSPNTKYGQIRYNFFSKKKKKTNDIFLIVFFSLMQSSYWTHDRIPNS